MSRRANRRQGPNQRHRRPCRPLANRRRALHHQASLYIGPDGTGPNQQPLEAGQRRWLMVDQTERSARLLVRALYHATDGERRWWILPTKLNDLTKEAIAG
jgi:hypothetical protein